MEKILIGVGCSHTQGCACIKGVGTEHQEYELASIQLKHKYKKQKVNTDWITENFSWIGHLGNLLNVDKKLNFGSGGKGVEHCVRTLRNYAFRKKDLSNHLIIFQVPSLDRREVFWDNEGHKKIDMIRNMVVRPTKVVKTFINYFHEPDYYVVKYMYELYFIQDYLKKLGAKVYFFNMFSTEFSNLIKNPKEYSAMEKKIKINHNLHNWSSGLTEMITMKEIIENLNIIDFVIPNVKRLDTEGLVKDDTHLSEDGNKKLATMIYNLIKDETTFT
jgi:hypothetical protein